MKAFRLSKIVAIFVVAFICAAQASDRNVMNTVLRDRIGGGNLVTHLTGAPSVQLYEALIGVGAKLARMDSYGWRDDDRKPNPRNFDAAMREAYQQGIKPIILLEYEGSYQFLNPSQPIGSYDDWRKAGTAFAQRFRPDGDWGRENGIRGWGVTVFTAINEPDVQNSIPKDAYRDALAGFADGVHGVDAALRVVPGGFATCNSHGDATLRGYGPAIAGLLQTGQLDGIDLHTYYNAIWYPIAKGREFSVQTCFDRIKRELRLTPRYRFLRHRIQRRARWRVARSQGRGEDVSHRVLGSGRRCPQRPQESGDRAGVSVESRGHRTHRRHRLCDGDA